MSSVVTINWWRGQEVKKGWGRFEGGKWLFSVWEPLFGALVQMKF